MSQIAIKDLRKHITQEQEDKYRDIFANRARYLGNGIYTISGYHSTDTRELFLMFVAAQEEIPFEYN